MKANISTDQELSLSLSNSISGYPEEGGSMIPFYGVSIQIDAKRQNLTLSGAFMLY